MSTYDDDEAFDLVYPNAFEGKPTGYNTDMPEQFIWRFDSSSDNEYFLTRTEAKRHLDEYVELWKSAEEDNWMDEQDLS